MSLLMFRQEALTPRQRHRARRLTMLIASLGLTVVLLGGLSALLSRRVQAQGETLADRVVPTSDIQTALAPDPLPAVALAQVGSPTPPPALSQPATSTPTQITLQAFDTVDPSLHPQIELTDMPLPAEEQLRIFVQLQVASPTPITQSAGAQPSTLYVPFLTRAYGPPTYVLPAARNPEPFYTIDGLSTSTWPAATQMSASKLTFHAIGRGDPYMMQFVRSARPRIVKTVGDFGWMAEVKAVDPNITVIGRIYGQDETVIGRVDPAQAATDYINQHLGEYRANPYIDYWEGWNEFVWTGGEVSRIQWFAQFEASRACQMQDLGLKAAVGGFAVGWPNTYAEFEHVLPMIEAAQRCGAIFHIHEYNRPLMYCGVASNRPDLIPGAPAISQPAGPLTLRYRLWYEGWLRPRGLADVPLLISEAGLDSVPATGDCIGIDPYPSDPSRKTWKHFGDWWVQQGIGASAELAYVNQLAWLDREMRHDSYVLGATIFTMGADGSGVWSSFDIHNAAIPLANYVASQR